MGRTAGPGPAVPLRRPATALSGAAAAAALRRLERRRPARLRTGPAVPGLRPAVLRGSGPAAVPAGPTAVPAGSAELPAGPAVPTGSAGPAVPAGSARSAGLRPGQLGHGHARPVHGSLGPLRPAGRLLRRGAARLLRHARRVPAA